MVGQGKAVSFKKAKRPKLIFALVSQEERRIRAQNSGSARKDLFVLKPRPSPVGNGKQSPLISQECEKRERKRKKKRGGHERRGHRKKPCKGLRQQTMGQIRRIATLDKALRSIASSKGGKKKDSRQQNL